jgi:hypothetical protein
MTKAVVRVIAAGRLGEAEVSWLSGVSIRTSASARKEGLAQV